MSHEKYGRNNKQKPDIVNYENFGYYYYTVFMFIIFFRGFSKN